MEEQIAILVGLALLALPLLLLVAILVKLGDLSASLRSLHTRLDSLSPSASERPRPSAPTPSAPSVSSVPSSPSPVCPVRPPSPLPSPPAAPSPLSLFFSKLADWLCVRNSFAPRDTTREFAVATRWLVRLGVVLVTGAAVYFAKLSIDRGWMGPAGRVAAMVALGAAACIAGVRLAKRTRYALVGHALAALGSVSLYLGFGLGHRFFDPPVIPSPALAFAALALVTFLSGAMSVGLSSPPIAVMALAGGYLVPFVAPCDIGSPLPLCLYMLLLNAGAFAAARARRWPALDALAAVLAALTAFHWSLHNPSAPASSQLVMLAFLATSHVLCMAGTAFPAPSQPRRKADSAAAWAGLLAGTCLLFAWEASCLRVSFASEASGTVSLSLSAVYFAATLLSAARRAQGGTQLVASEPLAPSRACAGGCGFQPRLSRSAAPSMDLLLFFALAYLAVSPPMFLGAAWCCVTWSLLAAAMASAGRRTGRRVFGLMALLTLAAAAIDGLAVVAPGAYSVPAPATPFAYARLLALRALRLWTLPLAAAWISRRVRKSGWLLPAAAAVAFLFYSCETWRLATAFFPAFRHGALTLAWTLAAFAAVTLGLLAGARKTRLAALLLLALSALKLLLLDTAHLSTPARAATFAALGLLSLLGASLYLRFKPKFEPSP